MSYEQVGFGMVPANAWCGLAWRRTGWSPIRLGQCHGAGIQMEPLAAPRLMRPLASILQRERPPLWRIHGDGGCAASDPPPADLQPMVLVN